MAFAMFARIAAGIARRGEESFMVARLEQVANLAVSGVPAACTDEVLGGPHCRRALNFSKAGERTLSRPPRAPWLPAWT
jgi:hypothetical protein